MKDFKLQSNLQVDNALDDYMMELIAALAHRLHTSLRSKNLTLDKLEWYDEKNKRKFNLTWEDRK